jgi:D-galactarolactone cycloisomerase
MLDVNCAWSPEQTLEMAKKLQPYDLAWLEEPLFPPDDFDWLARVRREGGIPTAAGENLGTMNDFNRMIDADAVDVIQPDVTKFGGITEMMKAIRMAGARGQRLEPHSPLYGPGLIATLHLIAAMPGSDVLCEYYFCDLEASPCGDAIDVDNGFMRVPDGPGLGIEVDPKLVERYRAG